jgi:hypothetical protein
MRMHITYKSLKPVAGALALTLFAMVPSMGGCGGRHVRADAAAPSTMSVTSSAQFEVGNAVK